MSIKVNQESKLTELEKHLLNELEGKEQKIREGKKCDKGHGMDVRRKKEKGLKNK